MQNNYQDEDFFFLHQWLAFNIHKITLYLFK